MITIIVYIDIKLVYDVEKYNVKKNNRNQIIGPRVLRATDTLVGFRAKFDI